MRLLNYITSPTLLGLSRQDILRVRHRLITLYLDPEQFIEVAPPDGTYVGNIKIYPCVNPTFKFQNVTLWLKVPKNKQPHWDYSKGSEICSIPFDLHVAYPAAVIIKAFASYFPFIPTEKYLNAGGRLVA